MGLLLGKRGEMERDMSKIRVGRKQGNVRLEMMNAAVVKVFILKLMIDGKY